MAISKYIYLEAQRISAARFFIELPDIDETLEITLNNKELEYDSNREYLKSGFNQFLRKGIKFNKGYKIKITGDIPINAGAASSSALVIAWLYFLNVISGNSLDRYQLANEGYNAEVKEFGDAGGKMDFFSSAYGHLIYLEPKELYPNITEIPVKLKGFVLGNSLEKKETVEDLKKVKSLSMKSFEALKEIMPSFDRFKTSLKDMEQFLPNLEKEFQKKIHGNILNREITLKAKNLILNNQMLFKNQAVNPNKIGIFYHQLGNLLNLHQYQLKNNIEISTKKIDDMISRCIETGALGAKINGSGFGGTMFALAPGKENKIKTAIEKAGGDAYLINTSKGVDTF